MCNKINIHAVVMMYHDSLNFSFLFCFLTIKRASHYHRDMNGGKIDYSKISVEEKKGKRHK